MRALRPGLKSSRQAQMTETGAIGLIDLPSLETGVRSFALRSSVSSAVNTLPTAENAAERLDRHPLNGSRNGYAIGAETERQPWDPGRLQEIWIARVVLVLFRSIGRGTVECIIAETKFLGNSAGSGVAVIWTTSLTTWNIERGSARGI